MKHAYVLSGVLLRTTCGKEVSYDTTELAPSVPVNCVVQCWEGETPPPKTTDTVTFTLSGVWMLAARRRSWGEE